MPKCDRLAGGRRRDATLAILRAYADRGRFPRPDRPVVVRPGPVPDGAFRGPGARMPLFRDGSGTWCAVGELLAHTAPALAHRLARDHADAFVLELADPELDAWAEAHGYSREDLARIQPTYCWDIPLCEHLDELLADAEGTTSTSAACGPVDVVVLDPLYCQDCDPPFRVFARVENRGTAEASISVRLLGDTPSVFTVPSGVRTVLGPFEAPDQATVNDVALRFEIPGNCGATGEHYGVNHWQHYMTGYAGFVLDASCPGGCPCHYCDSGIESTPPPAAEPSTPAAAEPACGCDGSGVGWSWLGASALAGFRRRRR